MGNLWQIVAWERGNSGVHFEQVSINERSCVNCDDKIIGLCLLGSELSKAKKSLMMRNEKVRGY